MNGLSCNNIHSIKEKEEIMTTIGELCTRDVIITSPETTITEAAQLMRKYHVGDLLVTTGNSGKHTPIGIVTDRDIVVELIAMELDVSTVTVGDIMSQNLHTAGEEDGLTETIKNMRDAGVRRLPVVDSEQNLIGIFSLDDAVEIVAEQLHDLTGIIHQEQRQEHRSRVN